MNALVVLCNPKKNSFNHTIANTAINRFKEKGYNVIFHDLYEDDFNPVLRQEDIDEKNTDNLTDEYIKNSCNELKETDVITIIHPNWWGQPPALMKGWIDCILRMGIAYRFSERGESIGLLKAKKAYIFNTSNTPEEVEFSVYKDPLDNLWKNCIFGMCGIKEVERVMFKGLIQSDEATRQQWLQQVVDMIG